MKKLLLIDSHALIYRFFHALPPLTTPDGRPSGAVYGMARVVMKILKEIKPDYIAAAFDRPEKTFRAEEFKEYKIHRPAPPPELVSQFDETRRLFEKFGIKVVELAGYEADDLIGSLVEKFKDTEDLQIFIFSGDLDTLQLVEDDKVMVNFLKKGISETELYNKEAVVRRYGLKPTQLPDLKGLLGDVSDNIPGVKGVGPKTAAPLIQKYGTLEKLVENIWEVPDKVGNKIEAQKEIALFSKKLATIQIDVPLGVSNIEELGWGPIKKNSLVDYFHELGFTSLVAALEK